jgi:hypothetical protein
MKSRAIPAGADDRIHAQSTIPRTGRKTDAPQRCDSPGRQTDRSDTLAATRRESSARSSTDVGISPGMRTDWLGECDPVPPATESAVQALSSVARVAGPRHGGVQTMATHTRSSRHAGILDASRSTRHARTQG